MATVAVTGTGTLVGRAVLARLHDEAVTRLVGVDVVEPDMPMAKLEFRSADVRDRLLPVVLDSVDVAVRCALEPEPDRDEDTLFARIVHRSRNPLEAVAKVGARKLIVVSSGRPRVRRRDLYVPAFTVAGTLLGLWLGRRFRNRGEGGRVAAAGGWGSPRRQSPS